MDHIPGLQLGTFEYTTVDAIRAMGLANVDVSDTRLRELIRDKSQIVNDYTEQWFAPVEGEPLVTGRQSPIVMLDNGIMILAVDALRIIDRGYEESGGYVIPASEYVVGPRFLELVALQFKRSTSSLNGNNVDPAGSYRVTRGVGNQFAPVPRAIKITGVFGWLEEVKGTPFTTTTTGALVAGAKTVVLTSVSGLSVRDVLVFGSGATAERAIVTGINKTTRAVTFPALSGDYSSGATVRAYGKVPRQIERAVQDLVYLDKCAPYEQGQPFVDKVLTIGGPNSPLNGIGTGSLKVDLVLSQFVAPPRVGFI